MSDDTILPALFHGISDSYQPPAVTHGGSAPHSSDLINLNVQHRQTEIVMKRTPGTISLFVVNPVNKSG